MLGCSFVVTGVFITSAVTDCKVFPWPSLDVKGNPFVEAFRGVEKYCPSVVGVVGNSAVSLREGACGLDGDLVVVKKRARLFFLLGGRLGTLWAEL